MSGKGHRLSFFFFHFSKSKQDLKTGATARADDSIALISSGCRAAQLKRSACHLLESLFSLYTGINTGATHMHRGLHTVRGHLNVFFQFADKGEKVAKEKQNSGGALSAPDANWAGWRRCGRLSAVSAAMPSHRETCWAATFS